MTKQERKIKDLFSTTDYKENHEDHTVNFTVGYHPNFAELTTLSKILKTVEIDTQDYINRGCPTCGPDLECEITCREVIF